MATPSSTDGSARLWADLCLAAPSLLSARALRPDASAIATTWSQRDVVCEKKRDFTLTYARAPSGNYSPTLPVPAPASKEFLSPSARRLVRFVAPAADRPTEVQIWAVPAAGDDEPDAAAMMAVWKVPASVHGPVFVDDVFGGVAWSPDEALFIYVADRPHVAADADDAGSSSSAPPPRAPADRWIDKCRVRYAQEARDVLGEAYVGQRSPALFLADVAAAKSRPMCVPADDGDEDDESTHFFGDPQWSRDGRWIAVTRRPSALRAPCLEDDNVSDAPHHLGVKFCYNRYSSVELMRAPRSIDDAEIVAESLTPVSNHSDFDDFCCSSPRFSPDSGALVYVSAPRKGEGRAESSVLPHNTTKVLRAVCLLASDGDPASSAPVTIVGVVRSAERDVFPGLYLHALPRNPWLGRDAILCSSVWGSETRVLRIPFVADGKADSATVRPVPPSDIRDVTPSFPALSCTQSVSVADVCKAGAILIHSSPVHPPQVSFLPLQSGVIPVKGDLVAMPVSSLSRRAKALTNLANPFASVDLVEIDVKRPAQNPGFVDASVAAKVYAPGTDDPSVRFQVTLLVPATASSGKGRVPLIVYPHGGPHSSSLNSFSPGVAAMLLSGFAVMHINFRGSLGLGQDSLESLPGRAGVQDVSEVLQATQWALQSGAPCILDENKVGYVGGSHGGFLGAHCSIVKGNLYKAVALRNPVCNVASMAGVTDIPTWAYCESGASTVSLKTGVALSPDPDALAVMWRASPVSRVVKGGTKPGRTVLFVGAGDRRVPPEQSLEWQRLITGAHEAGIVTLRWYPESGHAIDEVCAGDDVWVHTLELFSKM